VYRTLSFKRHLIAYYLAFSKDTSSKKVAKKHPLEEYGKLIYFVRRLILQMVFSLPPPLPLPRFP
jgi:hypothetical protein